VRGHVTEPPRFVPDPDPVALLPVDGTGPPSAPPRDTPVRRGPGHAVGRTG